MEKSIPSCTVNVPFDGLTLLPFSLVMVRIFRGEYWSFSGITYLFRVSGAHCIDLIEKLSFVEEQNQLFSKLEMILSENTKDFSLFCSGVS